jgi:signal transduction histidine kinase
MIEDITSQKKAEAELADRTEELSEANIRLKELDKLKSMFIASMSHELRTPLNSIIGFTGLILQGISGKINHEAREDLQIVYDSSKHLLSLINDVIDISKIESERIEVYFEEMKLDEVLKDVVTIVSKDAKEKKLEIKIVSPKGLSLISDRKRLFQCALNLMSNAVKFTQKGSIELKAVKKAGILEISVTDTGIGMKKKDLPKLFTSFTRLNSPLKEKTSGTGLGLYLTKKMMKSVFNGDIKVESRYGKGSVFTLIIPLDKEAAK